MEVLTISHPDGLGNDIVGYSINTAYKSVVKWSEIWTDQLMQSSFFDVKLPFPNVKFPFIDLAMPNPHSHPANGIWEQMNGQHCSLWELQPHFSFIVALFCAWIQVSATAICVSFDLSQQPTFGYSITYKTFVNVK